MLIPKHKSNPSEEVKEIIEDVNKEVAEVVSDENAKDDRNNKRVELSRFSKGGEINYSISAIKKASSKKIGKMYSNYERERMIKANEFLTDLLIFRFADLLGGLDAVQSVEELDKELRNHKLLK